MTRKRSIYKKGNGQRCSRAALCLFLCLLLLLTAAGCSRKGAEKYQAVYLDLFDTVTVITGHACGRAAFDEKAAQVYERLARYDALYDIYTTPKGDAVTLYTLNQQAGIAPVPVPEEIWDLLVFAKDVYAQSRGAVNIAMGSVLTLWHRCRTQGMEDPESARLPQASAIESALAHMDLDRVVLNEAEHTVFFSDPDLRLDVGAVGKGYAAQQVMDWLREEGETGWLISIGGNVSALGTRAEGSCWRVGIEDPEGEGYLAQLRLEDGYSVATSGSYQRYYTVDGVDYHHIIDPATGYPARGFVGVSVIAPHAGLADALSTALFVLDEAQGRKVLAQIPQTEALWLYEDGTRSMTEGFQAKTVEDET